MSKDEVQEFLKQHGYSIPTLNVDVEIRPKCERIFLSWQDRGKIWSIEKKFSFDTPHQMKLELILVAVKTFISEFSK